MYLTFYFHKFKEKAKKKNDKYLNNLSFSGFSARLSFALHGNTFMLARQAALVFSSFFVFWAEIKKESIVTLKLSPFMLKLKINNVYLELLFVFSSAMCLLVAFSMLSFSLLDLSLLDDIFSRSLSCLSFSFFMSP